MTGLNLFIKEWAWARDGEIYVMALRSVVRDDQGRSQARPERSWMLAIVSGVLISGVGNEMPPF
jgi:hypothetical protein